MKYLQLLSAFYSTPAAILPEKWEEIRAFLHLKASGGEVPEERVQEILAGSRPMDVQMAGRVAILPIFGVIAQRVGLLGRMSGGVSTEAVGATLESLVADRQVRSILLAFDSPGGSVFGVEELGRKILSLRSEKRIVALADSVAASAAYWLASQASEVNVTPGGQVGSIGVIAAHVDISELEKMAGIKTTLVSSSRHKAEFAPEQPLAEEAHAELQGKVDHYHGLFVAAVARGRGVSEGTVNREFGQGRMVTARDAVSRGMADHVATLEQVLRRLGETPGSAPVAHGEGPGLAAQLALYRARAIEVQENSSACP